MRSVTRAALTAASVLALGAVALPALAQGAAGAAVGAAPAPASPAPSPFGPPGPWTPPAPEAAFPAAFRPVTDAMLRRPDEGEWLSWRRTLDSWGYSPLSQITPANAAGLNVVWTRALSPGLFEGTPLVHDGVMFVPEARDRIEALDAATGKTIWSFQRQYAEGFGGGGSKRNIAIWQGLIISSAADGYVFALDARTGKQVWETKVTDWKTQAASTSSGPIIADGKVISGRNCAANAGPDACVIVAHDAATGKELWRTRTMPRPGEPGDETWGGVPDEKRLQVGTWMPPSYDPELKLIYVGTSVTAPTPKYLLAGNDKTYLYSTSTLALDPQTGKIVWHYQHIVDHWDFDHTFERILIDTEVAPDPKAVAWINPRLKPGERRPVLTGIPGKTGIIYTLDRRTGEFLWASPTVRQNVVASIDGATGKVTGNPATMFTHDDEPLAICPSFIGGKNWPAGAYSPKTGMMYMPVQNLCSTVTSAGPKTGDGQIGMRINYEAMIPDGETEIGQVRAISASTGTTAWTYRQRPATMSIVSTGGGVLFFGDPSGGFHALDEASGKVVWETRLPGPVGGFPISFQAGGKQYVAVGTGNSPEAMGENRLTPELKPGRDNVMTVFALP